MLAPIQPLLHSSDPLPTSGNTEFGLFVSAGRVEGGRLLLTRRYIDEFDVRAGKSLTELLAMHATVTAFGTLLPPSVEVIEMPSLVQEQPSKRQKL
jgi:hypothetical protein